MCIHGNADTCSYLIILTSQLATAKEALSSVGYRTIPTYLCDCFMNMEASIRLFSKESGGKLIGDE